MIEWFKNLQTAAKVWLIIGIVALIAAVVLCIVFRKKIAKLFRVYKSEVKKIVWFPWPQTRKSTLLVWVIMLISALVICLLDLGLGKGLTAILDNIPNLK